MNGIQFSKHGPEQDIKPVTLGVAGSTVDPSEIAGRAAERREEPDA